MRIELDEGAFAAVLVVCLTVIFCACMLVVIWGGR